MSNALQTPLVSTRNHLAETPSTELRVVIIYDEVRSGLRAKQTIEDISGKVDRKCDFHLWRTDFLNLMRFESFGGLGREGFDLIALSVSGNKELSSDVWGTIRRVINLSKEREVALIGMVSDHRTIDCSYARNMAKLRALASAHKLPLFLEVEEAGKVEVSDSSQFLGRSDSAALAASRN